MRDFIRGTLGNLAQVVLSIFGLVFILSGLVACGPGNNTGTGSALFVLGVICFCAVGGIRYWLGHIIRKR